MSPGWRCGRTAETSPLSVCLQDTDVSPRWSPSLSVFLLQSLAPWRLAHRQLAHLVMELCLVYPFFTFSFSNFVFSTRFFCSSLSSFLRLQLPGRHLGTKRIEPCVNDVTTIRSAPLEKLRPGPNFCACSSVSFLRRTRFKRQPRGHRDDDEFCWIIWKKFGNAQRHCFEICPVFNQHLQKH